MQMLDRVKEQERQSYGELQQELKSLKTLLLSSRDSAMANANAGPPSIFSQIGIGKKPSIPAWQLAQTSSPSTPDASTLAHGTGSTAAPSAPMMASPSPFYTANGVQDESNVGKD